MRLRVVAGAAAKPNPNPRRGILTIPADGVSEANLYPRRYSFRSLAFEDGVGSRVKARSLARFSFVR